MHDIGSTIGLAYWAMQTSKVPGSIVEMGCFAGQTGALLSALAPGKPVHLYDSFQGLPAPGPKDGTHEAFQAGQIKSNIEDVLWQFSSRSLATPTVHAGWFSDLSPADMPSQIAFAFLDGDLYESIRDSLRLVYPRMSKGGVVLVHDYYHDHLPGVKIACDEFEATIEEKFEPLVVGIYPKPSSCGFIKK